MVAPFNSTGKKGWLSFDKGKHSNMWPILEPEKNGFYETNTGEDYRQMRT